MFRFLLLLISIVAARCGGDGASELHRADQLQAVVQTPLLLKLSLKTAIRTTIGKVDYILKYHGVDPRHKSDNSEPTLLTVITHADAVFEKKDLDHFVTRAKDDDDVFQMSFLENLMLLPTQNRSVSLGHGVEALLNSYGNKKVDLLKNADGALGALPAGPYVSHANILWQPWRVYSDFQSAFVMGFEPYLSLKSEYIPHIPATISNTEIVVPSRLYTKRSSENPLAGLRVAVKDAFDMKGVKTSLCNKAYHELYPESINTATAISILTNKEAIMVGKTRLSSLISKEDPTEASDYSAPFNPRGDGYQTPAGSSSGSAVAVASYDWLDVSIGTDTNGSGRKPAVVNGCFGLRMTHGSLGTDGIVPVFRSFDVPSLFARNIHILKEVTKAWTSEDFEPQIETLPNRIVWLTDYLPTTNDAQMKVIKNFTEDLEFTLGVKRTEISLSKMWSSKPPAEAESESLVEFLSEAGWAPFYYDTYHNFANFRNDYEAKFNKTPYITAFNKWKWAIGSNVTQKQRDEGIARTQVYKSWMLKEIFGEDDSNTILILSIDDGVPEYRDAQPEKPQLRNGTLALHVSPSLGAPEISVPIGQIPYDSEVSGRTEQLPVGISVIARPGKDLMLVELIEKVFKHSGRPSSVLTGSVMY